GIRKTYPHHQFILVATASTQPFGDLLKIFNQIIVLDDSRTLKLITSSIAALWKTRKTQVVINLEFRSRLSFIFAKLIRSQELVSFLGSFNLWAREFMTIALPFDQNKNHSSSYDQLAFAFKTQPSAQSHYRSHLMAQLPANHKIPIGSDHTSQNTQFECIGIGHGCSDLSFERMLTAIQWNKIFLKLFSSESAVQVSLFGTEFDRHKAEEIIAKLKMTFPNWYFLNLCGELSLASSASLMALQDRFFSIDSSLVHLARLLGVKTYSYWGPTSPDIMLRPSEGLEEYRHYSKTPCSPCVHIAQTPPCGGKNICIQELFVDAPT
ncbi:MAG: hypothetical protein KDD38_10695, partial [Bdellovibrionales bacterium]|nr:hypothetical protein [Bdellovibrionales bacterium]